MQSEAPFRLVEDTDAARAAAELLFRSVHARLSALLPAASEILHIGATAIPGCLTKGDLDILIRVDPGQFEQADTALAHHYARNAGSIRTATFSAFEDAAATPHLGIQLTAKGGEFDDFHVFAEALRATPTLVAQYNDLKLRFDGRPMDDYRAAKDEFVAAVIASAKKQ